MGQALLSRLSFLLLKKNTILEKAVFTNFFLSSLTTLYKDSGFLRKRLKK